MRLYHHPLSLNARRAVMTALHLGADVELVHVDLSKREQRTQAFLRMNPNGRVPVLDDDGFFLTESHAIMQYLADRTPGQTLLPAEPRARADVSRWLFWNAHHFTPAVSVLNWENVVKPMIRAGEPDPREVARGEALVAEHAAVLDGHLAGKRWIAEDRLTLADLAIATPLMATVPARLPVSGFSNVKAWFSRVQELDAWRRTNP
jgi:glutathione S-transferase